MPTVYLICLHQPFRHARHYLGYTKRRSVWQRMDEHLAGTGSRLLRAVNEAGIGWSLVRVWRNATRDFERSLKNRNNAPMLCPVCCKQAGRRPKGGPVCRPRKRKTVSTLTNGERE